MLKNILYQDNNFKKIQLKDQKTSSFKLKSKYLYLSRVSEQITKVLLYN